MSKIILPLNQTHTITVNNGTVRSFLFNADGTATIPGNVNLGNSSNAYHVILNAANITTSDKTFTFNNRSGTLALEDNTSLINMLPPLTGNSGKFLSTDGSTVFWGSAAAGGLTTLNGISTSTYSAQTFAIGTSGTSPAWVSISNNTNTHTLNIPMASTASVTAGLLSNTDYGNIPFKNTSNTFAGTQTFTNAPIITTPSTASNAVATYGQLQTAQAGLSIRPPVAAIDTVDTTLPTSNPVVDTYSVALGDRILFTALSSGNNEVYVAGGTLSSMTWTLATDGQDGTGLPSKGDILFIKNGTVHSNQQYAYEGTNWVQYSAAQPWTFSTGLSVVGQTVTVSFGTTSTTACIGNDSRLSDSRTPLAHTLDGALHTISGKTAGQVMLATSATTFGFTTISGDLGISATGVVTISTINSIALSDVGLQQNIATLADNTSTASLVTGCSWAIASYRTIRISFSITRGSGNYSTGYIVLLHDGTTPRVTYIEDDSIGTNGITFTTAINTGNIQLLYTTTSTGSSATIRFRTETFAI
jgi:hypothetical protein